MKKKYLVLLAGLLLSPLAMLAQSCDNTVSDDSNSLSPVQVQQVTDAAAPLINQGADVRVRTVGPTQNLDQVEAQYERSCSSWQGASGGRKNSLIVLMVSPTSRKLGLYYGSAWHPALDQHWNRIKTDYMVPKFRDHDWTGGFIAAETQLASRITASKDEALHSAVTNNLTQNAATDFSGLWFAFKLLIAIGLVSLIVVFFARRRREKNAIQAAQQAAILARARARDLVNRFKELVTPETQVTYDNVVEELANLMNNERSNPDTLGLSKEEYLNLQAVYTDLSRELAQKIYYKTPTQGQSSYTPDPTPEVAVAAGHTSASSTSHKHKHHHESTTVVAPVIYAPSETTNNYETPSRRSSDDDNSSSSRSSSDSDSSSSGGGSSSWSDTSSSDSGGSSSFDSGSSSFDSGSGGSSDF